VWGLFAAIALIVVNAFFVAAEYSMVRVRPSRLERLARKGNERAKRALGITASLERYLSVSQIGITLASLALGWIGEPAIAELVEHASMATSGHALGASAHGIAIGIAFGLLTFMHVLIGEQAPKMIALHRAEALALALATPFTVAFWVLSPVRVVLELSTRGVLALVGVRGKIAREAMLSEEDLYGIIAATLVRGRGAEEKRQLLERVVRFASRQARHAMVPRVDVAYLPISTKPPAAMEFLRAQEFSRVVLTERDDLDRVAGYLYAKDLLLHADAGSLADLRPLRRDVLYVPEAQSLIQVLRSMQESQTHIAIVVDEYGGTSGILTMEDLLEEIVGEIRDEADEEEIESVREVQGHPGEYDVEAATSVDELRSIGVELGEDGGETVGGWVVRHIGRLPRAGDRVRMGAYDAEVRAIRRRRIVRVRLYPRAPTIRPAPAAPAADVDLEIAPDRDDRTNP